MDSTFQHNHNFPFVWRWLSARFVNGDTRCFSSPPHHHHKPPVQLCCAFDAAA